MADADRQSQQRSNSPVERRHSHAPRRRIVFNPKSGLIEFWDNKFFMLKTNVSVADTLTNERKLQRNIDRAIELVRASGIGDKARVLWRLANNHGYERYIGGAGAGNSVRGITNRLKILGVRFGSAKFIARSGLLRKSVKGVALVGTVFALSEHLSELKAAVRDDMEFNESLGELGPGCDECDDVSDTLRNASLLTALLGIGGEEVLGNLGSAGGAALAGLLGLPTGPGAILTGVAGGIAGGVLGDAVGREFGTSMMESLTAEDHIDE